MTLVTTNVETPTLRRREVHLRKGLPALELEKKLLRLNRVTEVGRRSLAFYLADMATRNLHSLLGFATTVAFAETRLDLSRRTARELLATGRALEELPRIDAAFAEARLSWTKARLLAGIATPKTEEAWLERALLSSTRRLEREIAGAEKGRPPREGAKGLPSVRVKVELKIDPILEGLWQQARARLSDEAGEALPDVEVFRFMVERTLRAPLGAETSVASDSLYRVVVRRCPDCREAEVDTADGPIALEAKAADAIDCDAKRVDADDDDDRRADPTRPVLRQRVLARDGFRCRSCGGREALQAHHLIFRSEGGPTMASNLAAVCSRCHALVHENLLRIEGEDAACLRFIDAMGRDRDRPLEDPESALVIAVAAADEPRSENGEVQPLPPVCLPVTFDSLPAAVDAEWWRARATCFAWDDRRGRLEVVEGATVAEVPQATKGDDETAPARHSEGPGLQDLVGQDRVRGGLAVAIRAAQLENRTLPHVLFSGPPGLGKTTLARALAFEMGARCLTASAPLLTDPTALVGLLTGLKEKDVLFIDELHALPRSVAETLYEAMENRRLALSVSSGVRTRTLEIRLPSFTLAGATTDPDLLPRPLLDRFPRQEILERYSHLDLTEILRRRAATEDLPLDDTAAKLLASTARGTPRRTLALFACARDESVARARHSIGTDDVDAALRSQGIDAEGFDPRERRALGFLASRRPHPIGAARLAALLDMSSRSFRRLIEPELLRSGRVGATSRGLVLTS